MKNNNIVKYQQRVRVNPKFMPYLKIGLCAIVAIIALRFIGPVAKPTTPTTVEEVVKQGVMNGEVLLPKQDAVEAAENIDEEAERITFTQAWIFYKKAWPMNLLRRQMEEILGKIDHLEIELTSIEMAKLSRQTLKTNINDVSKCFVVESAWNWKVPCKKSTGVGIMQWLDNTRAGMLGLFKNEIQEELGVNNLKEITITNLLPHEQVMLARYYFLTLQQQGHPEIGTKPLVAWQIYKLIHYPNGGYQWYSDDPKRKDDTYDNNVILDVLDERNGMKKAGKDGKVTDGDIIAKMDSIPDISETDLIPYKYAKKSIKGGVGKHPEWFTKKE